MTWIIAVQFSDDQPVRLYVNYLCSQGIRRMEYDVTTDYSKAARYYTEEAVSDAASQACSQISPKLAEFLRPERAFS